MGIFMITISQISSHTAVRVYPGIHPATPASSLPSISALPRESYCVTTKVARDRARSIRLPVAIRTGNRQHLVDLGVATLVDADPVRTHGRHDPRVRQRLAVSIATRDVEAGIE
jgi:hypothetical protein